MKKENLIQGKHISASTKQLCTADMEAKKPKRGLYRMYAGDTGRGCVLPVGEFA